LHGMYHSWSLEDVGIKTKSCMGCITPSVIHL
jgi:hypothetical protein